MAKPLSSVLGRQLRTTSGKADSRRKLIGAVRAAAARLRLSDEDRHAIQEEVTGKASMSDMTIAEIGKVLDRLNRDRPAPMAHRAHVGKIRALWWTLYWLGGTDEPNDAALDAFVRRQTGLQRLQFVDYRAAPSIIEALKSMAARQGVAWPSEKRVAELRAAHGDQVKAGHVERVAVIEAIWAKLRELRLVHDPIFHDYVAHALKLGLNPWHWTARELDEAIRMLGKRLRRAMAKRSVD